MGGCANSIAPCQACGAPERSANREAGVSFLTKSLASEVGQNLAWAQSIVVNTVEDYLRNHPAGDGRDSQFDEWLRTQARPSNTGAQGTLATQGVSLEAYTQRPPVHVAPGSTPTHPPKTPPPLRNEPPLPVYPPPTTPYPYNPAEDPPWPDHDPFNQPYEVIDEDPPTPIVTHYPGVEVTSEGQCCVECFEYPANWGPYTKQFGSGMGASARAGIEFWSYAIYSQTPEYCKCECCQFRQFVRVAGSWFKPAGDAPGAVPEQDGVVSEEFNEDCLLEYYDADGKPQTANFGLGEKPTETYDAEGRPAPPEVKCYGRSRTTPFDPEREADHNVKWPCEFMMRDRPGVPAAAGTAFMYEITFLGIIFDVCNWPRIAESKQFTMSLEGTANAWGAEPEFAPGSPSVTASDGGQIGPSDVPANAVEMKSSELGKIAGGACK